MRTTIDMPEVLFRRLKTACAQRNITLRDLVINALEQELSTPTRPFRLRDASAGFAAESGATLSAETVNQAIDSLREDRPPQP